MGLFSIAKSIGDSHGLMIPGVNGVSISDFYDSQSTVKSQTWKLVDDALKGLKAAPQDGDYKAFIDTYSTLPWIYVCAWVISTTLSSYEWGIYEGIGDDLKEVDKSEILNLLNRPNMWDSFDELIELVGLNLELTGNSYWEENGKLNDLPVALYNLPPNYIRLVPDPKFKISRYQFDLGDGSQIISYEPDEIIHFKYANPSSQFYGLGTVKSLQTTLITELNRETFNRAYLENEARPDVVLKHTADPDHGILPMTREDRDKLANEWVAKFTGPRNRRKPVVVSGGLDIEILTNKDQDMQYIELEKSGREKVLGAMGVPPAMVGLFEYANYANSREQIKIYHTVTMPPKRRRIENRINRDLVKPFDSNLTFRFKTDNILALEEDPKDREERLKARFDRGIINRNEYRAEIGKDKIDEKVDPGANKYVMTSGYMTTEDIFTQVPDEEETGGLFE
jgi:HK97 family phage portal protein